jgi:hypothetical protein
MTRAMDVEELFKGICDLIPDAKRPAAEDLWIRRARAGRNPDDSNPDGGMFGALSASPGRHRDQDGSRQAHGTDSSEGWLSDQRHPGRSATATISNRVGRRDRIAMTEPPMKDVQGEFIRNPDGSIARLRWGYRIHARA